MAKNKERPDEQTLGIRLLEKSKSGVLTAVFSRMGIVLILLLLNLGMLLAVFAFFDDFIPQFFGAFVAFTLGMVLYIINSPMEPTGKITWLIIIMFLPVSGSLFYVFVKTDLGQRTMKKRLREIYSIADTSPLKAIGEESLDMMDEGALSMTRYVSGVTGIPVYTNTHVTYFPGGEDMLDPMLAELRLAKNSIYMEYFIVEEGVMWGRILEVLSQKAAEGVDVRLMYDGTCEFALLPKSYPKKLKALGIACRVFSPVTPFVSTHYNYRDHRKILTIDGKTAFTGGVNLADEYINAKEKFGHWKDAAIMLKGDAARGFERMFLHMWNLEERDPSFPTSEEPPVCTAENNGFVMPYYDDPLDSERVGRQVYMDMLARAKRYVRIMTPYLILDGEMESAMQYAAKRGVEVTLLLPGIPDKKMPYALAKSHYSALTQAGVKIYEYTPGFVHAKVMVADGTEAVVGTINLDYRSLYHHFECAAYVYGAPCIADIETDFNISLSKATPITRQSIKSEKVFYKVMGKLLKVIAPLM